MQNIVELSRDPAVAGRVVFLENYNIELAQAIIPGCDIWLNTPRKPYEASGTSGMKAAVNGVPNLSVLDGWWAEAYDPSVGWALAGESDEADAAELYRLLEVNVVPRFAGPGRVGRAHEDVDRATRPALLDAAGRDRVRRAVLPAGVACARRQVAELGSYADCVGSAASPAEAGPSRSISSWTFFSSPSRCSRYD